ncbi:MAG: hypothetical protein JOY90_21770 [Bradyrhizobium sp.]|uniref:hypothetical protein n=1 Tax=Bradyrhizobium sp. TaxID=376 RepID=UPI001D3CE53A|nr:hypothetical protein [Bradyrhizobium sp.]MBV9563046.1 hypothetical protein [Bradyrhizobium sp.]
MTELPAMAPTAAPRFAATRDALDRLTSIGWTWGLAAILAGLALSFLLFGYAVVYWRNADMDFMVIYSALAMNDSKPQHFLDHTAYLTIDSVRTWFALLHGLGWLDAFTLPAVPPATDAAGFDIAMTNAVRAGRVLAFLIAVGCVLIFAHLIRRIVRDWRVALLATLAFALSGGVAVHSRILRSELVAACPVIFALMILIVIGRRASALRPAGMALAAALCVIGLENKVQAILLIGALPLVILPFGGEASGSVLFWRTRNGLLALAVAAALALAAGYAAWPLIATGLDQSLLEAARFHPLLLGRFGVYQVALALLMLGCMLVYAAIWRVSAAEAMTSAFAVVAGAALALLLLDLDYNAGNVIAVVNPLEKMLTFVDAGTSEVAHGSSLAALLSLLLQDLGSVIARYTFVLHSSPRPTVFLVWLIIPAIVHAWRTGKRQAALQALVLLLMAVGIDTLGVRRGLKVEYFIFTDPLVVLSGAVLLDAMPDFRFHNWTYPIALTLLGLHIAVGQAEPIKYAFMRKGPQSSCEWNGYYMPLMPLPWCLTPSTAQPK